MPVTSIVLLLALMSQSDPTASGIDAFRTGRFHEARQSLEQALAKNPQDTTAQAFLAMTKAADHDCQPAIEHFDRQADATLARIAGLAAVECESANKHNAEALALISKLRTRYPSDADVIYEQAKLFRKGWDSAVADLYAKAPSSYRVNQLSGEIFEAEGKYSEAAAQYALATEKAPNALNLHFRLGRSLQLESSSPENLEKARTQYELELKLNPADAAAEYELGQIASAQLKLDDASVHYQRALDIRPDFIEALIAEGKIYARNKQYDEAVKQFKNAIAIQPDSEAGHYNLMLAYRNSGHEAEALQQKKELDKLQKPPEGEFSNFLKKLESKDSH